VHQVQVDVVRCCGWAGDKAAALSVNVALLRAGPKIEGEEQEFEVLGSGDASIQHESRDLLLSRPSFLFSAGAPLPSCAAAGAGSGVGDAVAAVGAVGVGEGREGGRGETVGGEEEESGGEIVITLKGATNLPKMESVGVSNIWARQEWVGLGNMYVMQRVRYDV